MNVYDNNGTKLPGRPSAELVSDSGGSKTRAYFAVLVGTTWQHAMRYVADSNTWVETSPGAEVKVIQVY